MLKAEQAVEALQDGLGRPGAVAIVADEAAHEEAVALLDLGLIVLATGSTTGEPYAVTTAPAEQTVGCWVWNCWPRALEELEWAAGGRR